MLARSRTMVMPTDDDIKLAKEGSRTLSPFVSDQETPTLRITDSKQSVEITLPQDVFKLLISVLAEIGRGNAVTVMPVEAELTTQQAADFLNVSRPFLISLLGDGQIPYRKVGTRRRVKLIDILSYKRRTDEARMKVLEELTAEAQELDMGY
jgi:excisionase family DNA binding protein